MYLQKYIARNYSNNTSLRTANTLLREMIILIVSIYDLKCYLMCYNKGVLMDILIAQFHWLAIVVLP